MDERQAKIFGVFATAFVLPVLAALVVAAIQEVSSLEIDGVRNETEKTLVMLRTKSTVPVIARKFWFRLDDNEFFREIVVGASIPQEHPVRGNIECVKPGVKYWLEIEPFQVKRDEVTSLPVVFYHGELSGQVVAEIGIVYGNENDPHEVTRQRVKIPVLLLD